MTAPHRYIENQFAKISRGTQLRLPLIVADEKGELWHEIHYIVAREAERFKIVILALSITPFGYEAVIFDPEMNRSHFLKSINQCISCAVKRRIDHRDSLWSNSKPGNTAILDMDSLKKEVFNVCVIPVKAGYVRTGEEWNLPSIGPVNWGDTLSFDDPRQAPKELKKRTSAHNPGIILLVDYAGKILALRDEIMADIQNFEHAEKRRRKHVLERAARFKMATFLKLENQSPNPEVNQGWVLCASEARVEKVAVIMKAFYEKYVLAFATLRWPNWSDFPCGTLKMREYYAVTCEKILEDDPFLFDPS